MNIYCTYITIYKGNKLPPFYIGSSTIERVYHGYHGSVRSKRYRKIWEYEIINNPHLFTTKVISTHETRDQAIHKERHFHVKLNVVRSSMYINMSLANVNGYFGMNVNGENNPNYGNKWSTESRDVASKRVTEHHKLFDLIWISNKNLKKTKQIDKILLKSFIDNGWVEGRLYMKKDKQKEKGKLTCKDRNNTMACCIICHMQQQAHFINHHYNKHFTTGIEYMGKMYSSLKELKRETGCSSFKYEKYKKRTNQHIQTIPSRANSVAFSAFGSDTVPSFLLYGVLLRCLFRPLTDDVLCFFRSS